MIILCYYYYYYVIEKMLSFKVIYVEEQEGQALGDFARGCFGERWRLGEVQLTPNPSLALGYNKPRDSILLSEESHDVG